MWNQSVVPCPVLTVASWPAFRFLRRQVRWSSVPISWRIFHVCCDPHSHRLWHNWLNRSRLFSCIPCFCDDPADVDNLISGSSTFSKSRLNICKVMVYILLKPGLENFEHYFASVWGECNCAVVWTFFCIVFLWDWNENWPFPVLWPGVEFSKFAGI